MNNNSTKNELFSPVRKLHEAVRANNLEAAKKALIGKTLAIRKPINPNETDDKGYGALHYATSKEMVDLLCEYKAQPKLRDGLLYGKSDLQPIHTAANAEVTRALIEHGADPDMTYKTHDRTNSENSAFHVAKSPEQIDVLVEFAEEGMINQCNASGQTPLDLFIAKQGKAPSENNEAIITRIKHHGGKTADEIAQENAELISKKKADRPDLVNGTSVEIR